MLKEPKGINIDRLGAIIVGILVAVAGRMDIFQLLGMPLGINYLGYILTGLLISRGSNFLHDLLGSMNQVYNNQKNTTRK